MILPKYNMYIGLSIGNLSWQEGKSINPSGEIVDSSFDDNCVSGAFGLSGIDAVYVRQYYPSSPGIFIYKVVDNTYSFVQSINGSVNRADAMVIPSQYRTNGYAARISCRVAEYCRQNDFNYAYRLHECKPYYSKLKITHERESGQVFFRKKISTDAKFLGQDYDILKGAGIGTQFIFKIDKQASDGFYSEAYCGTFSKANCKFDVYKKQCTAEYDTLDVYTELLNNWENEYNIIGLAPAITKVNASLNPVIQSYIRGSSTIAYFFAGTYQEADVLDVIDDPTELTDTYHFAFVKVGNEINITGLTGDNADGNGAYVGGGESNTWSNKNGWYLQAFRHAYDQDWAIFWLYNASGDKVAGCAYDYYGNVNHTTGDEQGWYIEPGSHTAYLYSDFEEGTGTGETHTGTLSTFIVYPIYQRVLTNLTSIDNKPTYEIGASDMAVSNINYKRCIGLLGGNYFFSTKVSDEPTMFGINDYSEYFDNKFIPPSQGQWRPLPVCRSAWGNGSVWYAFNQNSIAADYWPTLVEAWKSPFIIKDAYALWDVIAVLLEKTAGYLIHNAQDSYILYGNVTDGALSDLAETYPILAPKTNVLKASYDQPAQKAETSLKAILDNVATMFNCYWDISNTNELRIESKYWFENNRSYAASTIEPVDITTLTDRFNLKKIEYFQGEIEYSTDDLVKRYEMSLADKSTELFDLVSMEAQSNYVKADSKQDLTPNGWATDIDLMLAIPDSFGEDGFALMMCKLSGVRNYSVPEVSYSGIVSDDDIAFQAYMQNGYASWIYLTRYYLLYAAVQQYSINKLQASQYAKHILKSMEHKLRMPVVENIEPLSLVETEQGVGVVVGIERDLVANIDELTIAYEPE